MNLNTKPKPPLFPEAACVLIVKPDYGLSILVTSRRKRNPQVFPTLWGLPGGKVDPKKDALRNGLPQIVNAAIRETEEETGVLCEIVEPFFTALSGVISGTHVVTTFLARYLSENPAKKIEQDIDHRWMTWVDLHRHDAFPKYNQLMAEAYRLKYP